MNTGITDVGCRLTEEALFDVKLFNHEHGDRLKRRDHTLAVMGCPVNGPGEAKEADLGVAGGKNEGLLFKKGEIIKKVPESELLSTLKYELENWNG